ncbi:DivIVA domain-containing protein [Micromonospora sp. CPCC 206060]|uniref:DivIVA domain-containing protein n=1 Tax=Micromonospora sp. CPCC 206060 TaxID=3122406 RepID=UPI002FEF68FE
MGQLLLILVVALTVGAVVFGVTVLVTGSDPGLAPTEPDGRSVALPGNRPLAETDIGRVRFDTAPRGYRMAQVDQVLRRAAYDIGYKSELIEVLEAEVTALREGRTAEADDLRRSREAALGAHRDAMPVAVAAPVDGGGHTAPADGIGHTAPADGIGHTAPADGIGHTAPADGIGHTAPADGIGHTAPADGIGHTASADEGLDGAPRIEVTGTAKADADDRERDAAAVPSDPVVRSESA